MRTKTLLLTAAVFAAGIGASMAQVYSVNAVGYVNVPLLAGYNLIANPLNGTNNNINTVIPVALADSLTARWSVGSQAFLPSDTYFVVPEDPTLNGWYDAALERSSSVIAPGEGLFIYSPSATTLTFVGEVPQGNLTNTIGAAYGFYSSIVPQQASFTVMGFPGRADMTYTTWDATAQTYNQSVTYYEVPEDPAQNGWYDGGLNPATPVPAVAQGFLIFNPGSAVAWGRTFSVNN